MAGEAIVRQATVASRYFRIISPLLLIRQSWCPACGKRGVLSRAACESSHAFLLGGFGKSRFTSGFDPISGHKCPRVRRIARDCCRMAARRGEAGRRFSAAARAHWLVDRRGCWPSKLLQFSTFFEALESGKTPLECRSLVAIHP